MRTIEKEIFSISAVFLSFAKIEKKNCAISPEPARQQMINGKLRIIEKETFSISAVFLNFTEIEKKIFFISPEAAWQRFEMFYAMLLLPSALTYSASCDSHKIYTGEDVKLWKSAIKRKLLESEMKAITNRAFGQNAAAVKELTDGWANAAYQVTLEDGRSVIVKAAPP